MTLFNIFNFYKVSSFQFSPEKTFSSIMSTMLLPILYILLSIVILMAFCVIFRLFRIVITYSKKINLSAFEPDSTSYLKLCVNSAYYQIAFSSLIWRQNVIFFIIISIMIHTSGIIIGLYSVRQIIN